MFLKNGKKKKKTLPEDFFVKNEKKYYWLYISVKNGKKITGYIFFPKKKKKYQQYTGFISHNGTCSKQMLYEQYDVSKTRLDYEMRIKINSLFRNSLLWVKILKRSDVHYPPD